MTLLIHPGFHKTGTTWLQEVVFAEPRLFRSLMGHQQVDELLVRPHDFAFDPAAARAVVDRLREGAAPGVVDVISSEILSGNILFGSRDCLSIADRVHGAIPEARVVLTTRAQVPIAKSIYLQYVKRGGRLGAQEFFSFKPQPGYFWFDPLSLEFDRLARAYADRYGSENVLVLPLELLKTDPDEYLRQLLGFAGIDAASLDLTPFRQAERGVSPGVGGARLMRMGNALRDNALNPAPSGVASKLGRSVWALGRRQTGRGKQDKELEEVVGSRFSKGFGSTNRKLQEFAPVDLQKLGYEID